ncbi:hypothetical protein PAHAL_9G575000 [Panicum hallii]|uniref:Uncharacterized protein n=1 Tax=Panicum hallii TaxID=206008 RepID=A0A2T8I629_9POAL|nr:hypothetical protein PAHAL_9G575000 [Panicum hallii]
MHARKPARAASAAMHVHPWRLLRHHPPGACCSLCRVASLSARGAARQAAGGEEEESNEKPEGGDVPVLRRLRDG